MKLRNILSEGEKYLKGLHQAKVGDHIYIGVEGWRAKGYSKIAKVLDTDKLVDTDGNIFGRNGVIIRRKGGWANNAPKGKIISAKIITQKEFDENYKKIKIDHIRNHDWSKEDIKTIEKINSMMRVSNANTRNTSRFD